VVVIIPVTREFQCADNIIGDSAASVHGITT